MLVNEPEYRQSSDLSNANLEQIPVRYRGWRISTKVSNCKLWLRWQHPQEDFPRYGCPLNEEDIASSIDNVRLLIDLAIKLEEEASKHRRI